MRLRHPRPLRLSMAALAISTTLIPGLSDVRPLHLISSDDTGSTIGGAVGRTWGQCCELQQLWVAAERRQQGIGSQLLESFEREAAARGCALIYLDTFSFQAPSFYALRGYVEVLRVTGYTGGVVKVTLQKKIGHEGAP